MSRHVSYQVNSEHCLNSMNQLGQACLRFSALLHTRIIQEVLPALENVIAVMVADLQRRKCLPTRSHTHGGNRLTGRKCRVPFAQATGRAGHRRVRWCELNASRVTEKALSAIRVAAMAKVRCWTRQKAIAMACR